MLYITNFGLNYIFTDCNVIFAYVNYLTLATLFIFNIKRC